MSPIRVALFASLCGTLAACGAFIGVDERHAGVPDAGASDTPETTSDGAVSDGTAQPAEDAQARSPQTLGTFVDPVLSVSETEILVSDNTTDGRATLTLFSKSDPTKPKVIYDQPADDAATRVSTIGIARSLVWFTTVDGRLWRMSLAGANPTVVDRPPSAIVTRSANTLWTATPDALSTAPTLHWLGDEIQSKAPEATLALGTPVMFTSASDDELTFSSRKSLRNRCGPRRGLDGFETTAGGAGEADRTIDGDSEPVNEDARRAYRAIAFVRLHPVGSPRKETGASVSRT